MTVGPEVTPASWGRLQLIIDGRDVTYFRGVPTIIDSWQLTDPYGYGPATFRFPQVTEFDRIGHDDLSWLRNSAPVRLWRVVWDGTRWRRTERPLWRGFLSKPSLGGTLTWDASGELQGQFAAALHQPPLQRSVLDVGAAIYKYVVPAVGRTKMIPAGGAKVGIDVECRGDRSMTVLGFTDYLLSQAIEPGGWSWTILPALVDGTILYRTQRRDLETIHGTIHAGAHGVKIDLEDDMFESPNKIYGEGVAPNGARWRNAIYPNLGRAKTVPPYPFSDGRSFGWGTLDEDTDTGDGISVLVAELRGNGLLSVAERTQAITLGKFTRDVEDAVNETRERAGLEQNGRITEAVWRLIFASDFPNQSFGSAHFEPLWQDPRTRFWNLAADGTVIGRNNAYDASFVNVDQLVQYGEGVPKSRARRNARAIGNRSGRESWAGTINLTTDPDTRSRFNIRAGMNLRIRNLMGRPSMTVHVSAVGVNWQTGAVQLSVDTDGRHYLDLAERRARNRDAKADPARQWRHQLRRSAQTSDSLVGWDEESGAGLLLATQLDADKWNVIPVVAGEQGTISRVRLVTDDPTEFAVAIFADKVSARVLNARLGNPLAPLAEDQEDVFTRQADWLVEDERLLVYAAGTPDEPCGHWPHAAKGALTGKHRDDASFDYWTTGRPFLWVAVWPREDTTIRGRLYVTFTEGA